MKYTGILAGSKFQYDVASKATAVAEIFAKRETTESAARKLGVTEVTVKIWIKKFYHSHEEYKNTALGVMRIADSVITGEKQTKAAQNLLHSHMVQRAKFYKDKGTTHYPEPPKMTQADWATLNGVA